jgi:hypothetical protein
MLCEDALYEMWLGDVEVFELVVASGLEFMDMHHRVNSLDFGR